MMFPMWLALERLSWVNLGLGCNSAEEIGGVARASSRRFSKKDCVVSWSRGPDYFTWDIIIGVIGEKI
jgi:hypothetical protein